MNEELRTLLQPSLQDQQAFDLKRRPWPLGRQFWVALFGGVLALGVVAIINAKRLGLEAAKLKLMVLVTLSALVFVFGFAVLLARFPELAFSDKPTQMLRIVSRTRALIAYVLLSQIQKQAARIYETLHDYASIWRVALIAIFALGTMQGAFVILVYSLAGGSL